MAESEEELKSLLVKVKVESEKDGLKLNIQKTKIIESGPITSWQIDSKQWKQWQTFPWGPKSLQMVTTAMKLKDACSLKKKSYDQPRQHIKKQRHYFAKKGPSSQGCGFSSSHVWMWELDYKESWALKNWCFELWCWRRLLSPLNCKEMQPVYPRRNQSWIFIGRTDAEAETPILWPPDAKNWLIWKDPDAGKDWRQEKGMTEDEIRRWNGSMASLTQWTWVWVSSRSWWWTGKPGMLQSMGSQIIRHNWETELNSAYRLNKQGDNIQPWCTPFLIWNPSDVPCPVLTVGLSFIEISQEAVNVVWYFHLLKNFPRFVVIHTVKGFGVVNKAEVDVFWTSLAFSMIQWILAIWCLVPLPFLNPAWTSGNSQFTYCWSLAWRIISITLLACEMSVIVR